MELNAEQVKKGLKICAYTAEEGCEGCTYWDESTYKDTYNDCRTAVCLNALALINEQERRIEKLEGLCKLRAQDCNDALDLLNKEGEKIEELTKIAEFYRREAERLAGRLSKEVDDG